MTDRFARDPSFWAMVGRAVIIGTLAGGAALGFNLLVREGTNLIWPEEIDYGWLGGSWWWIGLVGATGLIVGLLRMLLRVPDDLRGSLAIMQEGAVDRSNALQAIGISVVSLVGGASLGPFDGGVRSGAMVGDWYATIRNLSEKDRQKSTVIGINGSLAGMLTAPFLSTLLTIELSWPEKREYYRVLLPSITAAVFGFAVSFAVLGDTFLGVFAMPGYDVRFWHFGLAVVLGLLAAALSWVLGLTVFGIRRWVMPLISQPLVRSTMGGLVVGAIAMVLPLTLASGKGQLGAAIESYESLGAWLLIAVVFGKIVAVAFSLTSGFIGGPVMPALFIGGTAGLAVHTLIPEIPITLAFSCMLVAIPGISVGAPFTMIFLAALTVGVGAVETAPAGVAVLTAYTATAGMGWFGLPSDGAVIDIDEVNLQSELFEIGEAPGASPDGAW
jgi:H+/Cl- antiporter ClcA